MGSNNAIGTGALILSANADKLVSGLDKAEQLATRKTAAINAKINAADTGIASKIGGKLEGKFGEAFMGGAFGAVAGKAIGATLGEAADNVTKLVTNSHLYNAELEKSAALNAEIAKRIDRAAAASDERLASIADPGAKLAATSKDIEAATRELGGYKSAAAAARAELLELNSPGSTRWQAFLGGGLDGAIKEVEERLRAADDAAGKFSDRLAKLHEAKRRLEDPASDVAFVGEIDKATEALKIQAATWGKTGEEAAAAGFKARGATVDMLAKFEEATAKLKGARVAGEVDDATKSIRAQVATWGKGSAEVTAYGLKVKGASDASVAGVRTAGETLDKLGKIDAIERQADKLRAYDAAIGETTAALQKQQAVAAMERGRLADAGKEEDPDKKVRLIDAAADALKRAEATTAALTERTEALKLARERAFRSDKDEKLIGDIDRMTNALRDQVDTWGMNGREADIFRLKARGANADMLAGLEQQQAAADKLEKMQKEADFLASHKTVGAMEKGSVAAYSTVVQNQIGGMLGDQGKDAQKATVREVQKGNVILGQVRDVLRAMPRIGAI